MRNILVAFVISASILGANAFELPLPVIDNLPIIENNVHNTNPDNQIVTSGANMENPKGNHSPTTGKSSRTSSNEVPHSPRPPFNVSNNRYITEPNNILVLVNKKHCLSPDYVPPDLTRPDINFTFSEDLPKKLMRKEAAEALTRLFEQASSKGITLLGVSGYRSYQTQKEIFENKARLQGEAQANRTSARPGQSEHQTGLAMDITCPSVYNLSTSFGSTPEGKWVAQNAADFGFIIRYQKGKEGITGYIYEPWHLRYVGIGAARYIYQNGITLEEYLGKSI